MTKSRRKVRVGSVIRTRMQKTAVVEMVWRQRHPLYGKPMRRVARFYVHDPLSQCQVGDLVRIEETRPLSKTKRWRLLEILQRRLVAEVRPVDLETDAAEAIAPPPAVSPEGLKGDTGSTATIDASNATEEDTEE